MFFLSIVWSFLVWGCFGGGELAGWGEGEGSENKLSGGVVFRFWAGEVDSGFFSVVGMLA